MKTPPEHDTTNPLQAIEAATERYERRMRLSGRMTAALGGIGLALAAGLTGYLIRTAQDVPASSPFVANSQDCDYFNPLKDEAFAVVHERINAIGPGHMNLNKARQSAEDHIRAGGCDTSAIGEVVIRNISCLADPQAPNDGRTDAFECLVEYFPVHSQSTITG